MAHTLIVEDDVDSARMMAALIGRMGASAATALSLRDARQQLALQQPDLLLLDLNLPDGNGMSLLEEQDLLGGSEVVLMTGHASLDSSIRALRYGASDYLIKPVTPGQLQDLLARLPGQAGRSSRPAADRVRTAVTPRPDGDGRFGLLVGRSDPMCRVYEQIARVAGTSISVLITGESGTGKELVARTLHDLSRRRGKPFLAVNCGAVSPHLIESEIFGHEKGSFTGADRQHQGFFERAHGGTLFLDEVTEMPPQLQVKLLRVLETGSFMRVGSSITHACDVRVVAASNRDLHQAVAAGQLREDLLYRLNVFPIELPPLRNRRSDIPVLVRHFLQQIGEREGGARRIGPAAMERLATYRWPGNVRELRNVLQRAWVMSNGDEITDDWLNAGLPIRAPADTQEAGIGGIAVGMPLVDIERRVILATLAHFGQNKERTAAALGVSLKTLYNRLKGYGP